MTRMDSHRISIPGDMSMTAAGIVISAMMLAGIDPKKAADNPMMRQLVVAWVKGELSREDFDRACRNVLILNPGLASGRKG